MKKAVIAVIFVILSVLLVSAVNAKQNDDASCGDKWFCNQDLTFECQNFYNDSRYYTISKYVSESENFALDEQNTRYRHYETNVILDSGYAQWTSDPLVESILAFYDNNTLELEGGTSGTVNASDVNALVFCGFRARNGNTNSVAAGSEGSGNGVPEFPAMTAIAAVLVVTLGIVFLRKN